MDNVSPIKKHGLMTTVWNGFAKSRNFEMEISKEQLKFLKPVSFSLELI